MTPPASAPSPQPGTAAPASGAAPEPRPSHPPKNLQVLPKDWTREQVVDRVMRVWTADLGVRCDHCHAVEEGKPFEQTDFASDAKPAKLRAREMYRMLEEINRRLNAMPSLYAGQPNLSATCYTCHRGMARPRRIEDVLEETRAASGMTAAVTQYKDLRGKYLAVGGYDFSIKPLVRLARGRLEAKDAAGAQQLMDVALELGLDSLATRSTLADIAVARGDRAGARAQLEKALALAKNPAEKEFIEDQMKDLEAGNPTP
jgi:hypothetical protein